MNQLATAIVAGLVAGALVIGGLFFLKPAMQEPNAGAVASPDVTNKMFFHSGFEVGGGVLATTSQGAVTYTAAQIMNNGYIVHVASGALTATLPTAASLNAAGFLKNPGDMYTMFIFASTTKITLAGNTGLNLETASSTKDVSAKGVAQLTFIRQPGTENRDIEVYMNSAQ